MKRFLLCIFIGVPLFTWAAEEPAINPELLKSLQAAMGDVEAQMLFEQQPAIFDTQKLVVDAPVTTKPAPKRFESIKFYDDYLAKYYPKALVITNHFFAAMTPEAVESALGDIVLLLADRPYFYFVNDPKKFKVTAYWECIVDQLSLINEFLCIAYINQDRSIGFVDETATLGFNAYQPIKRSWLFDWLIAPGKKVLPDFFALCFDYTVKLFNEGILLPDFVQATRYLSELEWLAEKMRGSIYEYDYAESVETAKQLCDLLKQRMGVATDYVGDQHDWT